MPNNNLFLITMFVQKLSSLKFLDGFIELQIYQSIYKGPISFEVLRLLCWLVEYLLHRCWIFVYFLIIHNVLMFRNYENIFVGKRMFKKANMLSFIMLLNSLQISIVIVIWLRNKSHFQGMTFILLHLNSFILNAFFVTFLIFIVNVFTTFHVLIFIIYVER